MQKLLVIVLLAGLCGCFGRQPAVKTGLEGKPMPNFSLLLADSVTHLSTSSIPAGQPVVLFLFQPWCPFCKVQTDRIINDIKSLSSIRFYMFTTSSFKEFKEFYDHYQLNKYSNIKAGVDYTSFSGVYFKAPGVPYIAVYGPDKKLKQVLIGITEIDQIKDAINE